jgi:tetratricopeptide (TPR) repeat protein/tRNA A-37 threonylcarbamoyl transferase component Bud32
MPAPSAVADHNLIFGLLALQMDFVTRGQLLDAMAAWMLDKHTPLGALLCRRGVLAEYDYIALDGLVGRHIARHGNAQASLAALRVEPEVRQDLHRLDDADVQHSLAVLPAAPEDSAAPLTGNDAAADSVAGLPTTGPLADSPAESRFRRLREHAKGGLGEVHVALDVEVNREVALKEIQQRFADQAGARARFMREAEITGKLEHPGIVPVYGLGTYTDGRPYYAMRFIKGDSLQEAIAAFHAPDHQGVSVSERALELRQLLGRFMTVCQTMAYAHSRGVIHRDLKPGNVMLGKYGETLVVDWGLAKVVGQADVETTVSVALSAGDSALTQAGQTLGTPAYMSPEQAAGRADRLGPASDTYSLGATLYCLLTGRAPFAKEDVGDMLAKVQKGDFKPPRQVSASVPPALEAVCLKAMALKPEDRYASPRALADDLERWLADEPFAAYREPWRQRLARWTRRHRTAVTSASVALALLLAGAVGSLVLWESAEQKRREQAQEFRIQARSSGEADERLALAEVAADRLESAERILKQACERLIDQPDLGELRARLEARRDRVGRLVRFYHLADQVERRTFFNQSREARAAAEEGLKTLLITTDPKWWNHLPDAELTPEQIDKLKKDAYRLLLLAGGLRGLEGFTHFGTTEAAQAFHSAIRAFDQAEAFDQAAKRRSSRAGSFMRLFCRFGLDQRRQLEALPDGEPTSDVDHYLMGLAHLAILAIPDNPVVKLLLARLGTLLQGLDFKTPAATAEKYLRRAVELNPHHFFHHLFLGRVLRYTKQDSSAELALNTCVALRPDGALGYLIRAEALRFQYYTSTDPIRKDYLIKRILEDADKVIRLEPTAQHFSKRGDHLLLKGDLDKAVADFSEAIRRDSGQNLFYAQRSQAYLRKRELDNAVADVTEAIRLKPDSASHYALRAEIYMEKQEHGKAIADWSQEIRLDGKAAKSYYQRGDAYYARGEYDQGRADYRKAFGLNPTEVTSYFFNRAYTFSRDKQWARAALDLSKLVDLVPDRAAYRRIHASLLLQDGDRDKYWKVCQQTLEHFGQTKHGQNAINAAFACALAPLSPSDAKQVVTLAERGVAASPGGDWYLTCLGAAYYRAGQYDKSVAALHKSLNFAKEDHRQAMNWPLLAMACHQLGQEDKAREWLLKARQWHVKVRAGQRERVFVWIPMYWHDGVDFENFLSEAEGLLKKAKR